MTLKRVVLDNFMSYEHSEIDLDPFGVYLVAGQNLDEGGASSNGSGKSAFFDAVCWALTGETVRGLSADDVIRRGTEGAAVELTFSDGTTVRRTRTLGRGAWLGVSRDGEEIVSGRLKDGQAYLQKHFGIRSDKVGLAVFFNTVYLSFADMAAFVSPAMSNAERMALFESFLGLQSWSIASDRARSLLRQQESEMKAMRSLLEQIQVSEARVAELQSEVGRLTELKEKASRGIETKRAELDELVRKSAMLQSQRDRLRTLQREFDRLTQFSNMDELRNEAEELEAKLLETQPALTVEEATTKLSQARERLAALSSEVASLRSIVELSKRVLSGGGEPCPSCGEPLAVDPSRSTGRTIVLVDDVKASLDENSRKLKALEDAVSKQSDLVSSLEETVAAARESEALRRRLEDVEDRLAKASEMQRQAERVRAEISEVKAQLSGWESLQQEIEEARRVVRSGETKLQLIQEKLAGAKAELDRLQQDRERAASLKEKISTLASEMELSQYWAQAFKRIRSEIIDRSLPLFESHANSFLSAMDSSLRLSFELVTGKGARAQLGVRIFSGSDDWQFSQRGRGERARVAVAATLGLRSLALSSSGLRLGFLFFDEVVDAMDQAGVYAFVRMLGSDTFSRAQVFVISHDSELASMFPAVLRVQKRSGVSTIKVEQQ